MDEFTWSRSEKAAAKRAFDLAADRECRAIRREAQAMLEGATDDQVVWRLHDYLSGKRREFGRKYDYRYSVLVRVFGRLIAEGWLTMDELSGLREEKLEAVRRLSSLGGDEREDV